MTEKRIDDIRFVLTAIIGVGWILTTVLWLADLGIATVWVAFSVAVLIAIDVVLYFHFHTNLVAWVVVFGFIGIVVLFSLKMNTLIKAKEIESKETEGHGWLVPANDSTPTIDACII